MLLLLIFATSAFVFFYKRTGNFGEERRIFRVLSGVAGTCAAALVVGLPVAIVAYLFDGFGGVSESARILIGLAAVVAWLGGLGIAKWAVDRFLPVPQRPFADQADSDEFSSNAL